MVKKQLSPIKKELIMKRIKKYQKRSSNLEKMGKYICGLLSGAKQKTFKQMAAALSVSYNVLNRSLESEDHEITFMEWDSIKLIKKHITFANQGHFIIDDSVVIKEYAKKMDLISPVFSSLKSKMVKGYVYVFVVWTNGIITIPLKFKLWLPKKVCTKGKYKTKIEIAKDLLLSVQKAFPGATILLDGLFQSQGFMKLLTKVGFKFFMRLPRNRKIRLTKNGKDIKLNKNKDFKLQGNCRSSTWFCYIKEEKYYVTAEKRKKRDDEYDTVYIVSNTKLEPKETIKAYRARWNIEKFFRTAKQSLGLQHCQSVSFNKQKRHIMLVCATYSLLETTKEKLKLNSAEEAKRALQKNKSIMVNFLNIPVKGTLQVFV